jgi:hypothetical protein
MHDHPLTPLLAKKDSCEQQRVNFIPIALAGFMTPDSVSDVAYIDCQGVVYGGELSLPLYVRAQILLL